MDLTEAEDIKKRWQEYTEQLYKKDFHDQDNHDGVITHLNIFLFNQFQNLRLSVRFHDRTPYRA